MLDWLEYTSGELIPVGREDLNNTPQSEMYRLGAGGKQGIPIFSYTEGNWHVCHLRSICRQENAILFPCENGWLKEGLDILVDSVPAPSMSTVWEINGVDSTHMQLVVIVVQSEEDPKQEVERFNCMVQHWHIINMLTKHSNNLKKLYFCAMLKCREVPCLAFKAVPL